MELKEELKKIKLDYEDKINIPDNKFGLEIEFSGALIKIIESRLNKLFDYKGKSLEEIKQIEIKKIKYEIWKVVNDSTVQESTYYEGKKGGEINSPKMTNEKKYWDELKQVCKLLKTAPNIEITKKCSIHIHTEKTIYNKLEEYKNLLKIWILYEDIIYRFAYGEIDLPRETILAFAKPFCGNCEFEPIKLIKKLDEVETEQQLISLLRYDRRLGLNITNIIKKQLNEKHILKPTIETRIYNGTLNENLIQNIVRFNQNLLKYAKTENFDKDFIEYQIKNYQTFYYIDTIKEKPEKAEQFSKMIFKDELDRLKFLKQYYKAYTETDIEKTLIL